MVKSGTKPIAAKTTLITFILLIQAGNILAGFITNGGFETGDFTGWTISYGSPAASTALIVVPGPAPRSNNGLTMVYSGNYACQLFSSNGASNHANYARIERNETVPPGFTNLVMWFAAVLDGIHYTDGSPYNSDAYVLLEILNGTTVIYSQRFSFFDNFVTLLPGDMSAPYEPWKYLPWTKIIVPLAPYVGDTLTIRYTAYDCEYSAHACYGYIDAFDFEQPPTPTATITVSPTDTVTPTITQTESATPTFTITDTCSETSTITPTGTDTVTPTITATPTVTATVTPTIIPARLTLVGPFPNPGTSYSNIIYHLTRFADIYIKVYDVSGEVITWAELPGIPAGNNDWYWNLKNIDGRGVADGTYLVRMMMDDIIYKRKDIKWCKVSVVK
jgi:hypothetical protein